MRQQIIEKDIFDLLQWTEELYKLIRVKFQKGQSQSIVNHQNDVYLGISKIIWKHNIEINFVYLEQKKM